jgi:hypothetical protein
MTDIKKIAIMDNLLKEAKDPQMKALSACFEHPGQRFRICELLIEDGEERFWVSIEYPDK